MNKPLPPDPCRCPLCGQANACAMAAGDATQSEPCWCTKVTFSADLLDRLPTSARGQACICQACVVAERSNAGGPAAGGL